MTAATHDVGSLALKHFVDGRPVTITHEDDDCYFYKFDDDPRGEYWVLHDNPKRTVQVVARFPIYVDNLLY